MKITGDYMNDRKQHVIKMAHQLFIEKGFQATSIQDILECSGISKGTFYNYFPSKNELLMEIVKTLYQQLEKDRSELLIGQDPANIEIFIKQIELQVKMNRMNMLSSLFEEVNFLNDVELKQFLKRGQLRILRWLYKRFIDIFSESKKPYLLDCAIMFKGILHHNLKYYAMAHGSNVNIHQVVRYSVERVVKMVNEVAETGDQLIQPELLERWLPDNKKYDLAFNQQLYQLVFTLKKTLSSTEQAKYIELLDFIQDELLHSKEPRKFLIESALFSLKASETLIDNKEFQELNHLVLAYLSHS
jgi:AcrR family transcriptional regulator